MKRGTPRHKKMYDLARRLQIELPHAVGIMEMLWQHASQYARCGDIGTLDDDDIAAAVKWSKSSEDLIEAMVEAGWLHRHPEYRLYIHDWPEHCEESVKKWVKANRKEFLPVYAESLDKVSTFSGDSLEKVERESRESLALGTAKALAKAKAEDFKEKVREFPKNAPSPARSDPPPDDSVSPWESAGFAGAEEGDRWFNELVRKHPNRGRNRIGYGRFLERVLDGTFNRTEFERWYEEQVPIWAEWAQRNIQAPNLHAVMDDAAWRFPTVELAGDGMTATMRAALAGLENR